MNADYFQLYSSVRLALGQARRSAFAGQKDQARDFLRFVRNSRLVEIMRPMDWPRGLECDVALLDWELRDLETAVHPLAASDNLDTLSAINRNLNLLASGVSRLIEHHEKHGVTVNYTVSTGCNPGASCCYKSSPVSTTKENTW
jgi:hypothetical protein